jgi:ankyrin repeat protein
VADFFAAARKGDVAALAGMLMGCWILPTTPEPDTGMNALMLAAVRGHVDAVVILASGMLPAQLDATDPLGNTALGLARAAGHDGVVDALRARGAGQRITRLTASAPVFLAHAPVDTTGSTTSRQAGSTTTTTTTTTAVPAANVASTPLASDRLLSKAMFDAIEDNDLPALERLLTHAAAQPGAYLEKVLGMVLPCKVLDGWWKERTPLVHAAALGCTQLLTALISATGIHSQACSTASAALMVAYQKGHVDTVQALIQIGIRVDQADIGGWTSLMVAAQNGHIDTVQALIDAGAPPNQARPNGCTALLLAVRKDHVNVAQALVKAGASLDQADANGATAMMVAASYGNVNTLRFLLKAGASNLRDRNGGTALDFASRYNQAEVITLLRAHQARISASSLASWVFEPKTGAAPGQ